MIVFGNSPRGYHSGPTLLRLAEELAFEPRRGDVVLARGDNPGLGNDAAPSLSRGCHPGLTLRRLADAAEKGGGTW